ncbi:sulfatase-like hydrolase/transferase [Paludicola sp. MB14-C6]|uniref:sulfatase-like hydrolase/transferase n=1 Tax=Paludihabitans sp. MB14-C6 TaxID=3070656 RepID=UPI0027DAB62F|nr:sulfatase-like hydrolase/transferase [Paludicola sp. MB14-C6]WMJ23887.1 sulfatase-like hydrolase/transferase [Paludicola sp. MB14-C6]
MDRQITHENTIIPNGLTNPPKERKDNIITAILLSFAFSFNLFVFAPLDSYFSGKSSFWFSIQTIIPIVLIVFSASLVFCLLVSLLMPKKVKPYLFALMISGLVCLYLQGNFLTRGYPTLDGSPINWKSMITKGTINTIIWVIIIVVPLVIAIFKKNIINTMAKIISIIIIGLEIVTLITVSITAPSYKDDTCYVSNANKFNISKQNNILLILSDSFESRYMTRITKERPDIVKNLNDFTYFNNTSGIGTLTNLSLPTIMTGELLPVGKNASDGTKECLQKTTFFDYMHEKNYRVKIYTESDFMHSVSIGDIDNLKKGCINQNTNAEVRKKVSKLIYKYSFFKYAPHFAKQRFVLDTAQFNSTIQYANKDVYTIDDKAFYNELNQGFHPSDDKNNFTLYHLNGPHPPATLNEKMVTVNWGKNVHEDERRYQQSISQMTILKTMIAKLKETNSYDNTTIIFAADHGNSIFLNPVLMVKPTNEKSEFKISSSPISLASDLVPFIKDTAAGKGKDAALFKIPEDSKRERYAYNFIFNKGLYDETISCITAFAVDGIASDFNSYKIAKDEYADGNPKNKYSLGDTINFNSLSENAYINGVFDNDNRTYGGHALVKVAFKEKIKQDLTAKLKIGSVYGEKQRLIIKANGKTVYDNALKNSNCEITFKIPKQAIQNNQLELNFELPDAMGSTGTAWNAYSAFIFHSISFE